MKKVFLIAALVVAASFVGSAQDTTCDYYNTGSFVHNTAKNGKYTVKECLYIAICESQVVFRVSETSIMTFIQSYDGNWSDLAGKPARRHVQDDGTVVFYTNPKKLFAYVPKDLGRG